MTAENVREALVDAMLNVEVSSGMVEFAADDREDAGYLADAILADPRLSVDLSTPPADDAREALGCKTPWRDHEGEEHRCRLSEDGHSWHRCTCGGTTGPSTPPAVDVREALIGCVARDEQDWRFGDFEETSNHSPSLAEYIADGILANPLFDVRPRGTVTDTEVEWEYRADFNDGMIRYTRDEGQARVWLARAVRMKRHRPMVPAGEWEPYTGEARP